ncbi:MAG: hypothetical protein WCJ57_00010 [Candidatus Falkowbacteria bacterium]
MLVFEKLRPVEALYLVSRIRKEEFSIEDSFKAVMVYLTVMDFIKIEDNKFTLTTQGVWSLSTKCTLRDYELSVITALNKGDDIQEIVDIVDCYSFRKCCLNNGILMKKWVKFFRFFPAFVTTLTTEGDELFFDLMHIESELESLIASKKMMYADGISNAYAFPKMISGDDFKEYTKDVINVSEGVTSLKLAVAVSSLCDKITDDSSMLISPVNFSSSSV